MQCLRCRHESPAGARFCGECGTPLGRTCPLCGALNAPGNSYCTDCGASVRAPGSPVVAAVPDEYTPKYLAEKIIRGREALEGERKQVTVLFADLEAHWRFSPIATRKMPVASSRQQHRDAPARDLIDKNERLILMVGAHRLTPRAPGR
jgi:hypothetical protein